MPRRNGLPRQETCEHYPAILANTTVSTDFTARGWLGEGKDRGPGNLRRPAFLVTKATCAPLCGDKFTAWLWLDPLLRDGARAHDCGRNRKGPQIDRAALSQYRSSRTADAAAT